MKNINREKILFMHNTAMWYRRPFFEKLSEIYDVKFVFTHLNVSKDIYNLELSEKIHGLEGVNYKILKNQLGIAFSVITEAMGDYEILVGGSWDSISELIETLLFFAISKFRRKKFIIWREDWGWKSTSFKKRLLTPIIKLIIRNSDAVLVPGIKHEEYFISLGASPEKIFIMPNVSNIRSNEEDYKKKEELKNKLNIGDKKVILYVGRLVKRKGVDYLIKAFEKLAEEKKEILLIVVGDGECRSKLESLSKKLGIQKKVYFTGNIENAELAPYYILCDICVIPSVTYGIGDPWVFILNEAMYFGKPVIATEAVGAAFDMIKNGSNGFIIPEKDVNALYDSMNEILSDDNLAKKMGENSKKIVDNGFKYTNMVKGFKNAVDSLTK